MAKSNKGTKSERARPSSPLLFELTAAEAEDGQPGGLLVLLFGVGDEKFAVEVNHTEGVVDCPRLTPLPSPPDRMIGVASVRGRMTLVLELGSRAGQKNSKRRLILLKGDGQLGLVADHIDGIVSLAPAIKPPGGKEVRPVLSRFKHGDAMVEIVDVDRLAEA